MTLSFGQVVYSETVLGYQRKGLQDHEVIDFQTLELPTVEFPTRALWYELDELIACEPFPPEQLLGALHALEHGQIAVLPLIAMCDRWDIGGLSTNAAPADRRPDDLHLRRPPGGVGITRRGYDQFERLVGDAQRLIGECPCKSGCPRACSRRSAATSTSRCPSAARSSCSRRLRRRAECFWGANSSSPRHPARAHSSRSRRPALRARPWELALTASR